MVNPVYGPIVEMTNTFGYYNHVERYKQTKPVDRPLPYVRRVARLISYSENDPTSDTASSAVGWDMSTWWNWSALHSRAYEKLKGKITSRAEVAVNLLEADRSIRMILGRTSQMLQFGKQLLRGNLVGAARVLRMSTVPKGASTKHSFARNYLEFHFGWSPLIQDIHSAVDHLENPLQSSFLRVSVRDPEHKFVGGSTIVDQPLAVYPSVDWSKQEHFWLGSPSVSMGMEVAINNPNLYLASSMGLVNPATIVWELIPYSFVVDWFVNVQQFLAQGTDFLGLTVMNPWTTRSVKGRYKSTYDATYHYFTTEYPPNAPPIQTRHDGKVNRHFVSTFGQTFRSLGIEGPELHVRPYKVWGWRRAASAVSLLTLQLKGR